MNERLRPLTLGEILDRTTQLYRHNFWTFAGVAAVPVVAMFAVAVPFAAVMGFMGFFRAGFKPSDQEITVIVAIGLLIALPVWLVAFVVSQVSLTQTAIVTNMGRKIKVREAIKSVWPRFWRYLGLIVLLALLVVLLPAAMTTLLVAVPGAFAGVGRTVGNVLLAIYTFLGFAAAFVYAIWRWLCYSMAMSTCILEEKTAWQSIKRANLLSKGTRGRIFVMYLLVVAVLFVVVMIVDFFALIGIAIAAAVGASKFGTAVSVVGLILSFLARLAMQSLIEPIPAIALVLFYFDQRVRKEGYDIELMMEQAGLTSPPVTQAPPATPEFTPIPESPLTPSFEPGAGTDNLKEP